MNPKVKTPLDDDLRPEYDAAVLKNGIRGKYVQRYKAGTNIIVHDPDVSAAFPDSQAVNEALRMLLKVAQTSVTSH